MNVFKKVLGENFVCTYYSAQCSVAVQRTKSSFRLSCVSYNNPEIKYQLEWVLKNFC